MPKIASLSLSSTHSFSKTRVPELELLRGLGVAGDAHMGTTVKHRSRVAKDPHQPNLRQVHLIHEELLAELSAKGFIIAPGAMGENVLTRGIDLLGLPCDAELQLGKTARIRITGLRNPCSQLDGLQPGLMKALLDRDADGGLIRKAGVMAVVVEGGIVRVDDEILVTLPAQPHLRLNKV